MNPLNILKTQLQNALNESTENEDYKSALSDAVYGCDLGVTALEQWIQSWITPRHLGHNTGDQYIKGVEFVEDKWHQITGMF